MTNANILSLYQQCIVIGSAEQIDEPLNSPRARDYKAADGTNWMGVDTADVLYFCSQVCCGKTITDEFGWITMFGESGQVNPEIIVVEGEHPRALTIDIEHHYGALPDIDVYCHTCGEKCVEVEEGE